MKKYRKQKSKHCKDKKRKIMLLSKCEVCDSKKSTFIKRHTASGLLSSFGIKTSLSKISVVGLLSF